MSFTLDGLICIGAVGLIAFLITIARAQAGYCRRCGEVNREGARFCAKCGQRLQNKR